MSSKDSNSKRKWLEELLWERFGVGFKLHRIQDRIRMGFVGDDQSITFVSSNWKVGHESLDIPLSAWNAENEGWTAPLKLPLLAPGGTWPPGPLIRESKMGFDVGYDILGLTYWMLSRQEELAREDLDAHGRFPATSSHAYKHDYLERPIVDEWLNILGQIIGRVWPDLPLRKNNFSIKLSHDVDSPSQYQFSSAYQLLRGAVADVVRRGDLRGATRALRSRASSGDRLDPADPYNTFDWIMDMSDRKALTSAFYFICGRTDAGKDALYEPEHPAIRALMRNIHRRGHEIGLHPSYNTFQSPNAILAESTRLRTVCKEEGIQQAEWGGRMHYLRWEMPTTLYSWEESGMNYDSTLGYADRPGFRCGTCFEYPAFDPVAGKMLNLRIRPLIAMDRTVTADHYLGLGTGTEALRKFVSLKEACKAVDGCFTLLWHNSQLNTEEERILYKSIIA